MIDVVTVLFWSCAGLIMWAYFGYFLCLKLLVAFSKEAVVHSTVHPTVSMVTTYFNEAEFIRRKIANCLELDYPADKIEFIFVSDGSTDSTDAIIRGTDDSRITLIADGERRGKDFAQGGGVRLASGEIVVFTDAKTLLERDAMSALIRPFADPEIGCVSGYDIADDEETGSGEGAYVKYEMALRRLETLTGSTVVVSGCFFAIRKLLCDEWHPGLTSDFYLPIVARQRGYRVVLAEQAIARYSVSQDASHEFRRKVRTVVNGLDVLATFKSALNPAKSGMASFQMANHKLLRWMVPWLMIVVFGVNLVILDQHIIYGAALGAQLLLYATALIAVVIPKLRLLSVFRIPFFFVMANLAILLAWYYFVRGQSQTLWQPTER